MKVLIKIFTILSIIFFVFFFIASDTFALSKEDEIKTAWRDILDREPTAEELQEKINNYPGFFELKKELNKKKERDTVITNIYQRALKRNPRPDELDFLKRSLSVNNAIRDQLFSCQERILALEDLYIGLLGRKPEASALDFYFKTRSDFQDIKRVLIESQERKNVVKRIFKEEMGREPNDSEIKKYLKEPIYLHLIKVDLINLKEKTPPTISNLQVGVNEVSAVILFDVNKKSSVKIEYGPFQDYGFVKEEKRKLFRHDMLLDNLIPGTIYHFKITISDEYGHQSVVEENNFLTRKAVYVFGVPFYSRKNKWNDGPAAIQMLLEYYGIKEEQEQIAEEVLAKLPIVNIYFTFPKNIVDYIKSKNFSGTESYTSKNSENTNLDYLKQKIKEGKPVLVKIQTLFSERYQILVGYTDESKEFIVYDPVRKLPNSKIKYNDFLKKWEQIPIYNPLYKKWSFVVD